MCANSSYVNNMNQNKKPMMPLKNIYISAICILLFSAASTSSYSQTFQWAKHMGSTGWEGGTAIVLDNSGNVYCTGYFRDTVDFDPGTGVFNLTCGGMQDAFISKVDASGNFIWAKQIGGAASSWEESHAITLDDLGNIYITGFFLGTADFDPAATTFNLTSSSGGDAFICKLDASGNFVWAKQIGGSLSVTAYSIAVDDHGNVYTTGYFDGTADFDPGPATFNFTVFGYSDIFISKLDSSGNFVWAKRMSGPDGEVGYSIAVDGSGNVYSTGTFFGTVDFDPGSGNFILNSPGQQEIYISKLDASGNFVWAKQMGGEVGYSIAVDHSGNVYATGYYAWADIMINKLDSSGNSIWAKQIGAHMGYSIIVDSSYNVYTTGQFYGTRDFDPGAGTFNLTAIGSSDSYINKLDSSGNFIWTVQLGGTNEVLTRALALDNNGNLYTTGSFDGTADFDHAATTFNLTSIGSYDIFLHKMSPENLGFLENNFTDAFKIYPNPTNGNFAIEFEKEQNCLNLVLRNITGQVVDTKIVINSNRIEMQINAASGIYLLEIADQNNQKAVVRIMKK